jgi:hypothetical protein
MSEWEPSAQSIEEMLRAIAEAQGLNFDEIPSGEIEDARRVAPIAIKAAVAADPLLSAAKEMQEALATIVDSTAVLNHLDREHIDMLVAVLAKSRGEQ